MSDADLLTRVLEDPKLLEALHECGRRGLVSAKGRRIRCVPDNPQGSPISFQQVIDNKLETIPVDDFRDGALFEMDGDLRLEGWRELLAPEPVHQWFGWIVLFNANSLRRFAADYLGGTPAHRAGGHVGRRGPKPGTLSRYRKSDTALFPELAALVSQGKSVSAAALELAEQGKIRGIGMPKSRAKRLTREYLKQTR